ncbi:MAG: DUF2156 domain-containing protein [Promethearchaeota archaeon]
MRVPATQEKYLAVCCEYLEIPSGFPGGRPGVSLVARWEKILSGPTWDVVMDIEEFKPLELDDKPTFDEFLAKYPPETSELTFTNLFIWRHSYRPCWAVVGECLCVGSGLGRHPRPDAFFLPPVGPNPLGAMRECSELLPRFERVPEALALAAERDAGLGASATLDRDQCDYLYEVDALVTLAGAKLKDKRKKYNAFLQEYPDYEYKDCEAVLLEDCRKIQEKWYGAAAISGNPSLEAEHVAVQEAFDHHEELGFDGGVLFVEGNPVAFTLGEPLNPETVVVHIEKADVNFTGSYQAINQMFLERSAAARGKEFVNREQDLGIPGLRRAKKSYAPARLVNKYVVEA